MLKLFTLAFWTVALEATLTAGLTAFAGSQVFVTGFNAKNFEVAGTAAVAAALAAFLKQLGTVQTVNTQAKVAAQLAKK
jgi:hypothetical protein